MLRGTFIIFASLASGGAAVGGATARAFQDSPVPEWLSLGGVIALCLLCFYVGVTIQKLRDSVNGLQTAQESLKSLVIELQKNCDVCKSDRRTVEGNHEARISVLERGV